MTPSPPDDGDRPLDPRVAQTRRIVVEAAAALLGEEGFERLTLESIAERSGVARSTIYRNWPDRAVLLADAFDQLCVFPEVPDLGSMVDELRLLAEELANGLRSDEWANALPSLVGAAHHDESLTQAQAQFSQRRRAMTAVIFERAAERGEVSSAQDPSLLAEYFAAPMFFRFLMTRQPIDDDFIERHIGVIVDLAKR
ncbi:MAG: TetR/AcrR family transcriptional regulator [Actinomycetota bacterium]